MYCNLSLRAGAVLIAFAEIWIAAASVGGQLLDMALYEGNSFNSTLLIMKIPSFTFQLPNFLHSEAKRTQREAKEQALAPEQRPKRVLGVIKFRKKPTVQVQVEAAAAARQRSRESKPQIQPPRDPDASYPIHDVVTPQAMASHDAWNQIHRSLDEWIDHGTPTYNEREARKHVKAEILRNIDSFRPSTSNPREWRMALSQRIVIPQDLNTILDRENIKVVQPTSPSSSERETVTRLAIGEPGPGPSTIAAAAATERTYAAEPQRLTGLKYRDQLRNWGSRDGLAQKNYNANALVVGRIREQIATKNEFTLDLSDINDLVSPPPMPRLGTKVVVAEGQFKDEDLQSLRDTGVLVTVKSMGDVHVEDTSHRPPAFIPSGSKVITTSGSGQPTTFGDQLKRWVSSVPGEIAARTEAQDKIMTWLGRYNSRVASAREGQAVEALPLDLSALGGLTFTTMPPIPRKVTNLNVRNQGITKLDIRSLPENLHTLDVTGNPLKDIDDNNLPDSLKDLQVTLGTTTLDPHIVRRLTDQDRRPAYDVYLPGPGQAAQHGSTTTNVFASKAGTYLPSWISVRDDLATWINGGSLDKTARQTAVQRLEQWLHQDEGQGPDTPLNFSGLGLRELPPVWPMDVPLRFLQAQGNQLQEIPLASLPSTLEYLDLRNNQIAEMPPELTGAQMTKRERFNQNGTTYQRLASELQAQGVTVTDPRIVDPRERSKLTVVLTGNQFDESTVRTYQNREFNNRKLGPAYIINQQAFDEYLNQEEGDGTIEAALLKMDGAGVPVIKPD